jgi:uncharacterized protein (TIGR02266 family)
MDQPPSPPKEPRGPVSLRIKFRSASLEQFIERYAVDVSRGGIFIRTREPLAVGTQLRFDFQLQDSAPLLAGEGTVVWIRENDPNRANVTPGMGVRFDKLTPTSQPTLERILADKARREQEAASPKTGVGPTGRQPSSTFSALDPARAPLPPAASEPPRMGGLSPLAPGAPPRAPQPPTGSGALRTGAAPRAAQPPTGSGPLGTKAKTAEQPVPQGIPTLEASGAFGRPRTTTGMGAQRSVPAPSALFEKPSAEDIDRALSVLTEVEGDAPEAMPEPVDFSARFRRPTEPQAVVPDAAAAPAPMIVKTSPAASAIPSDLMKTVRRPTDAQPLILESAADVGDASPRRPNTGTRPLFSGVDTGEQKLPTVPVVPIGGPPPASEVGEEPDADGDDDGQTSAWQHSGPTKVGGTQPDLAAFTGSGDDIPKADLAKPEAAKPDLAKPDLAKAEPPPALPGPSLDKPAPSDAPAIMSPNFAAAAKAPKAPEKKRSAAPMIILLLLAAGGAGAYYMKSGAMKPAATPEATPPSPAEPAAAAPTEPTGGAPAANPSGGEAGAGAAVAEAKPGEAKSAEVKSGEAKPSEVKPSEDKPSAAPAEAPKAPTAEAKPSEDKGSSKEGGRKSSRRRSGGGAEPAAAPAVADVSPASGDSAASAPAEAPKSGNVLKVTTTPAGAEVIIDGNSVGRTPFVGSDVDPSAPHAITIKKDGFEDHERMISGSDWPRAKAGVRTLKVNVKLRSTGGGEPAKPAEGGEAAPVEPPAGLGTTPTTPKRE